jgi:hypothetical protein
VYIDIVPYQFYDNDKVDIVSRLQLNKHAKNDDESLIPALSKVPFWCSPSCALALKATAKLTARLLLKHMSTTSFKLSTKT